MMLLRSCSPSLRWSSATLLRSLVFSRSVSSSPNDDDAPAQNLDLDAWKSVMKSQALQEQSASEEHSVPSHSELDELRQLVYTWRLAGRAVPQIVTEEQLKELAEKTTKSARKKFLKFLTIKEGHKLTRKKKQELKRAEEEAEEEAEGSPGEEEHQEPRNTFMLGFWTRSMDRLQGWRTAQAMMFGQPLVYDMSYEKHMMPRDLENTVEQLQESEGWNRRMADPFHLHYCSLQPDGAFQRSLSRRYGAEAWERLHVTTSARQHVELFPHRDLVYLTPDSRNVLHTFDHNKVYIIGALVDRSVQSGVSLATAKRLNLATARLPLDEYLNWDCGAKNLTLDQMIRILGTLKETGSWQKALEFVPKRKHKGFYQRRSDTDGRRESASRVWKSRDRIK